MTPRKAATADTSVEEVVVKSTPDPTKPRVWADVAEGIQKLREAGANVPEICEKLEVSYVLVNQVFLQSYKMAIDTAQVFERQEKVRLGLEG
jgi:hypothetical protein